MHTAKYFTLILICLFIIIINYEFYRLLINSKRNFQNESIRFYKTREIYVVTSTYRRPQQLAELTRLSHTLMLVPNIKWLLVENENQKNEFVEEILKKSGLEYYYLLSTAPNIENKHNKLRAVINRNRGLKWILTNASVEGVVYFADDDNTYDLELFNEIRNTYEISVFPVGLTEGGLTSPVTLENRCKYNGSYDKGSISEIIPNIWAGFAISVGVLLQQEFPMISYVKYNVEDYFKNFSSVNLQEIELLASCCTKVLVWLTKTKRISKVRNFPVKYYNTNLSVLKKSLIGINFINKTNTN